LNGLCVRRYLKTVDRHPPTSSLISAFITPSNIKFLLLYAPNPPSQTPSGPASLTASRYTISSDATNSGSGSGSYISGYGSGSSSTMPASEDNIKNFFNDVYDNWIKSIMSPFWRVDMPIRSPVFRARVAAAGKKYL
jgi:trafficking protein particle complex subunit 2